MGLGRMRQLTKEEAQHLTESGDWLYWSSRQLVHFQLLQENWIVPADIFCMAATDVFKTLIVISMLGTIARNRDAAIWDVEHTPIKGNYLTMRELLAEHDEMLRTKVAIMDSIGNVLDLLESGAEEGDDVDQGE